MEIIFLTGAIQALFFAGLLIRKQESSFDKKLLSVWFLFLGIHLSLLFLLNKSFCNDKYILTIIHLTFPLLHYPIFYLYVKSLVNKTTKSHFIELFHFAPYLIIFLLLSLFPDNRDFLSISNHPNRLIHFNLILNLVSGLTYMSLSLKLLKKYNKRIKQAFSSIDKINLKWLAHLIFSFCVVLLIGITYIILTKGFQLNFNLSIDAFVYGSITFFVFFIGFYSIKKTAFFSYQNFGEDVDATTSKQNNKNKYDKYGLKKKEIPKLKETLLQYMDEKKPYLDCNLTLAQLAEKLNVYKHYLTQILNDELNQNFFDFINSYRIEEVKNRLAEKNSGQYTLLGIAFDSGFNSKSSFNRIFKNHTGITPSQYKKSLPQKQVLSV